jgi:hypothetical protein
MLYRIALTLTITMVAITAATPPAFAQSSIPGPPEPGAELVSESVRTGIAAAEVALSAVDGLKIESDRAVLTVRDGSSTRPITLDYSDLAGGERNVTGLGYAAGAYLGLGLITRLLRVLRMGAGLLGR